MLRAFPTLDSLGSLDEVTLDSKDFYTTRPRPSGFKFSPDSVDAALSCELFERTQMMFMLPDKPKTKTLKLRREVCLDIFVSIDFAKGEDLADRKQKIDEIITKNAPWIWSFAKRSTREVYSGRET